MTFSVTSPQTSDSTVTITRVAVLTLADATNFTVGDDFACDGDGGNTAVGTVTAKNGNVITVSVTSGLFVSTNGIDNVNPFVGDETTISSVDEEYFTIEKDKVGSQLNDIIVYIDYTKDVETGIVINFARKDEDLIDEYFFDSYVPATGIAVKNGITVNASDKLSFVFQISRSEESMLVKITPSTMNSSGTINMAIGENNLWT